MTSSLTPIVAHAQQLQATSATSEEAGEVTKLIFKVFWSATYMAVPAILLQPDQFAGWMNCFHTYLSRPLPQVIPISSCFLKSSIWRQDTEV